MRQSDLAAIVRVRADLRTGAAMKARESSGLSASEVARVLKVTRQAVWQWERGLKVPSDVHALAYAKALAAVTCTQ